LRAMEAPAATNQVVDPKSLIPFELVADELGFPVTNLVFSSEYFIAAGACWRALNRWESTLRCNATHHLDVRTEGISKARALASLVNAQVPRFCCKIRIPHGSNRDAPAAAVLEPPRFGKHLVTVKVRIT